jgi:hypothetical protein
MKQKVSWRWSRPKIGLYSQRGKKYILPEALENIQHKIDKMEAMKVLETGDVWYK